MMTLPRPSTAALLLVALAVAPGRSEERPDPALAGRLVALADQLAGEGKTEQALARYREAWSTDPRGAFADDALLAIARLRYPVADLADLGRGTPEGLAEARPLLEQIRDEYPRGDAAPEALFRLGLGGLDPDDPERDLDEAWANFAAIVSVHPESPFAERALAALAVLDEELGRPEPALLAWFRLADEYPGSALAPRARLGVGRALLALGRADLALGDLQAAREIAGDDAGVAAEALDLLALAARIGGVAGTDPTRLYRPGSLLGATFGLRSVDDLAVSPSGDVLVADRTAGVVVAIRPDGTPGPTVVFARPEAIAVDARGDSWIAGGGVIAVPSVAGALLHRPLAREEGRIVEQVGALACGDAGAYAIDARRREVLRLDRRGAFRGVLALPPDVVPLDLAAAPGGGVLVLDGRGARALEIDAGGAVRRVVGPSGPGWETRRPAAVARDVAGDVYLLDARSPEVLVIRPDGSLLARIVSPREGEGSFPRPEALAVDRAGRVLLLDGRERRVVRYE